MNKKFGVKLGKKFNEFLWIIDKLWGLFIYFDLILIFLKFVYICVYYYTYTLLCIIH